MANGARRTGKPGDRAATGPLKTPVPDHSAATDTNGDPLHALGAGLAELRKEVRLLYEVRVDQLRVAIRDLVFGAVSKLVGWLGALALSFVAIVFVMYGTALGLASLLGDRTWLGFLLSGMLVLIIIGGIALSLGLRDRRRAREHLEEKYASEDQREPDGSGTPD